MNVYLKKGLDKLLFGMNQEDVSKLLGNPNRSFINSDDKNDLIWEFTELKMLLTFYKDENNRLAYIRSSNPEISINNL